MPSMDLRHQNWRLGGLPESLREVDHALLTCGVVGGPLFIGASLVQGLVRPGFDFARHPISLLLLGEGGWAQALNFELSGLLFIAFAAGLGRVLYRQRAGAWGAALVGIYGLGLLAAAMFPPDAAFGFPPGTAPGVPTAMSRSGTLHGLAFLVSALAATLACFVFARKFAARHRRSWMAYSIATGIAAPLLVGGGSGLASSGMPGGALLMLSFGVLIAVWMTALAAQMLAERATPRAGGAPT